MSGLFSGRKEVLPERADLRHVAQDAFLQEGWEEHSHGSLGCRARGLTHACAHLHTRTDSELCLQTLT